MASHSSIVAWKIPWTVYSPWSPKELDRTEQLSLHFSFGCLGSLLLLMGFL